MKRTAILVASLLGLAVASTFAQQGPPQGDPGERGRGAPRFRGGGGNLMGALDLNADGTLDAREIQNAPIALRKLDTNKDFKLTPDELGTRGGARGDMSQRMLEMDANKDGKLTSDEIPERMQRFIERMDTNGDGAVDKAEMDTFQQEMRRRFEEGEGFRGRRGGGPEQD